MSVDILGTSWDQCRSMVQYSFTSTETRRLVRMDSPGQQPWLSHSSWTMLYCVCVRENWFKCFCLGSSWERERKLIHNRTYVGNVFVLGSAGSESESVVGAAVTGCKQCKASTSKQSLQSLLTFSITRSGIINNWWLFYSANRFAEQKLDGWYTPCIFCTHTYT